MKSLIDRDGALSRGLADIRTQFGVPSTFPTEVLAEAEQAAARPLAGHVDWTDRPFVTLDPATSTDLDQAFAIERSHQDLILHYAIADTAWFVSPGGALDHEAWARGNTIYMPDGKASLYPTVLSEGAASLLPNVERPSVVFTVRIDPAGKSTLDGAVRAIIRSRAKLAYENVQPGDLPDGFNDLSSRIEQAEDARGAARVDEPQLELAPDQAGHLTVQLRPQLEAEQQNAALSLAANLAIAQALFDHHTGLFRVMPEPEEWAVRRLRHSAKALGLTWPKQQSLKDFERGLDCHNRRDTAFQAQVRRSGAKAGYAPFQPGVVPWHSAMAATYAHATAPLRRLADRYVIEATVRIAGGQNVPDEIAAAFQQLPAVMAKAEAKSDQIDREVLNLAEAVMLEGSEGTRFSAVITDIDERGARVQLSDPPAIARVEPENSLPGDPVTVELVSVDVIHRQVKFKRVD